MSPSMCSTRTKPSSTFRTHQSHDRSQTCAEARRHASDARVRARFVVPRLLWPQEEVHRRRPAKDDRLPIAGAPGFFGARALHACARQVGFNRFKIVLGGKALAYCRDEPRRWVAGVHIGELKGKGVGGKFTEGAISNQDVAETAPDFERWRENVC